MKVEIDLPCGPEAPLHFDRFEFVAWDGGVLHDEDDFAYHLTPRETVELLNEAVRVAQYLPVKLLPNGTPPFDILPRRRWRDVWRGFARWQGGAFWKGRCFVRWLPIRTRGGCQVDVRVGHHYARTTYLGLQRLVVGLHRLCSSMKWIVEDNALVASLGAERAEEL